MARGISLVPVVLTASLIACGGSPSPSPTTPRGEAVAVAPGEGGLQGIVPEAVAEPRSTAEAPRTPPSIGTPADAARAFDAGFYTEVEAALARLPAGPDRAFLEVRLHLARGRYDEAAALAQTLARDGARRVEAETLRAEALIARGRLADAENVLATVAATPGAFRAKVLLGRLYARQGRRGDARRAFLELVGAYNDDSIGSNDAEGLSYVAMAAAGLGSAHDANDAFAESTRADRERVETQIEWARLFLSKHDTGHAEESLREALARNPAHPEALALLARLRIEQSFDFQAARELVERALRVNPRLVSALVIRAGLVLRDLDVRAADAVLDEALAIDPHDLDALSVRAAVRYLAGDARGYENAKREVLRRHPTYSAMYSTIAEFAEWEHRYPDLIAMGRAAVALDPGDADAQAFLGLNLLRMGEEDEGLVALRESWRHDRFNVRVFNTLNLYEEVLPQQYEWLDAGPLRFRFQKEERAVLERYVPEVLGRAYRSMVRRYGLTPEGPVRVELYASEESFSVRTTGLPHLGVQGVCFGKVITAISPRGGPFNWGQITWHELAHVFHIQLSRNRVPRWFTEGLAEHESRIARPEWRRELDHALFEALRRDRLPPLRLMNRAFTHARSGEEMLVAYYASSVLVGYLVERFGFDAIVRMLREWAQDRSTEDVFRRALGAEIDAVDADFRAHLRRTLRRYEGQTSADLTAFADLDAAAARAQANPRDAHAIAAHAAALLVNGRADEAKATANRALALDANEPVARVVLARLALSANDAANGRAELRRLFDAGVDGYELRLLDARAAAMAEDVAGVRSALEAATRLDPERPEAWHGLAELAQRIRDEELRFAAVVRLARIEEHDREVNATALELLVARSRWDEVVAIGEIGTFVDPGRAETHRAYAEGLLRTSHPDRALYELDTALLAGPEAPARVHLMRARALVALRRRGDAQRAIDQAIAADASVAEEARRILGAGGGAAP